VKPCLVDLGFIGYNAMIMVPTEAGNIKVVSPWRARRFRWPLAAMWRILQVPTGGVGAACLASIKVFVLGFIFCEDGDLPEAGTSSSGRSDEFRKAPPANVIVNLMPGVC
jgi:hypothetical protein